MAAMMPGPGSGPNQSANPYEHYDASIEDDDLIDPDDGTKTPRTLHLHVPHSCTC